MVSLHGPDHTTGARPGFVKARDSAQCRAMTVTAHDSWLATCLLVLATRIDACRRTCVAMRHQCVGVRRKGGIFSAGDAFATRDSRNHRTAPHVRWSAVFMQWSADLCWKSFPRYRTAPGRGASAPPCRSRFGRGRPREAPVVGGGRGVWPYAPATCAQRAIPGRLGLRCRFRLLPASVPPVRSAWMQPRCSRIRSRPRLAGAVVSRSGRRSQLRRGGRRGGVR